jgi:toxin YoeB
MDVRFTESAHKDYLYWKKNDPRKSERIENLCRDIVRHPFKGIGKPEPLKFDLQGCWPARHSRLTARKEAGEGGSRRIDRTHRLVYRVQEKQIVVLSCRYHY